MPEQIELNYVSPGGETYRVTLDESAFLIEPTNSLASKRFIDEVRRVSDATLAGEHIVPFEAVTSEI